jgi:hypothetical protein
VSEADLGRLLGSWATEATHPFFPGLIIRGTADVSWLEGEHFLIHRARTDHPDFPDSIWIMGHVDQDRVGPDSDGGSHLCANYFDSRGVHRVYEMDMDGTAWRWWRDAPGFSQRFVGRFADGGNTIVGTSELCRDDVTWAADLAITYRRA